jgi:methylmalonyl-CoA mutase C-terminal domain/subunit
MTPAQKSTSQLSKKLRVLVAKVGLDGHDRGVKIVARALRDAGIEVIYLGIHNTPEEIAASALQEDADAIGLSIHSAAHLTLFGEVIKHLKVNNANDIVVFGGGIVPGEDIGKLQRMGVKKVFTPGAPLEEIVRFVKSIGVGTRKARGRRRRSLASSPPPTLLTGTLRKRRNKPKST